MLRFVEATHIPRLNVSNLGRALARLPSLDDLVLMGLTLWAGPVHEACAGPAQRVEELALGDIRSTRASCCSSSLSLRRATSSASGATSGCAVSSG